MNGGDDDGDDDDDDDDNDDDGDGIVQSASGERAVSNSCRKAAGDCGNAACIAQHTRALTKPPPSPQPSPSPAPSYSLYQPPTVSACHPSPHCEGY